MSISPQLTKRRRRDNESLALSKPFKSPLRPKPRPGEEDSGDAVDLNKHQHEHQQNDQNAITKNTRRNLQSTTISTKKSTLTHSSQDHFKRDPQFLTLQRQHSGLLLQLSKLRLSLGTVQQALEILSTSTDAELEILISKWKLASREAAEEVFRGAKDRVNHMGGISACQERSGKRPLEWDEEPRPDFEDLIEEQRERLVIQQEELDSERWQHVPARAEEVVGTNEESFTMDMMLRSLNIKLDVIGYDKENQRWYD